ncbi:7075_t:CDS:2, partial [Scutellospora calospora]
MELPPNTCVECEEALNAYLWCCPCQMERHKQNFKNWSSGNIKIDLLIQSTQLNATKSMNSQTLSEKYFDNILKHHQYLYDDSVADFFGISQDPTGCFVFVMRLYDENLYHYIDNAMETIRWEHTIFMLQEIIDGLKRIHKNGLYHGNLHGVEISNNLNNWITSIRNNPNSTTSRQFREANGERSIFERRTINSDAIYN